MKCEWNPEKNEAAKTSDGCQNEATWRVGSNGEWLLCEKCAALPEFERFRVRRKLTTFSWGRRDENGRRIFR